MTFLKKLFTSSKSSAPNIQFGRYSDALKTQDKNIAWDEAMASFAKKNYMDSYERVLEYLSDGDIGNIFYERKEDGIRFTLLQGSKKIIGLINQDGFYAEAKVAHCLTQDIALMRKLLEENYHLRYSRFAIDTNENITVIFQSDHLDATPYKLYYGLEELALRADNNDDFFLKRFNSLTPLNMDHTFKESEEIKSAKFDFWKEKLDHTINLIENGPLEGTQYPGAISYLILSRLYAFDYLIKPEAVIMKMIEEANAIFFVSKELTPEAKNNKMLIILKKMQALSEEDFKSELYETIKTFGVGKPGNHNRLKEIIDSELKKMDWYVEKGYREYALTIPCFIVGNMLYTYSLPKVDRALLQIFYEVLETQFFVKLKFDSITNKQGKINRRKLVNRINQVIYEMEGYYKKIKIDTTLINTSDKLSFAKSYLEMMKQLTVKK